MKNYLISGLSTLVLCLNYIDSIDVIKDKTSNSCLAVCAIVCPANIEIILDPGECDSEVSFTVSYTMCSGTVTQTSGLPSGSTFPRGTTTNCFDLVDLTTGEILDDCCFDVTVSEFGSPSSTLACDDQVPVVLDGNNEALITTGMVLEGGPYGCFDDYLIAVEGFGSGFGSVSINPSECISALAVTITDPSSGNSCVGNLDLESTVPTVQASNITFTNIGSNQMDVNWVNGNGDRRIVVINTANSFSPPANNYNPVPNTDYDGAGQQVIYNGSGSNVIVTGLSSNTTYWFRIFEAGECNGTIYYVLSTASGNPRSQTTIEGSGIDIISTSIPPWQREGDSYQGSVTVSTTPAGESWHLQVKVTNSVSGSTITTINYPSISSATQNFFSSDPQLALNSINERKLTFHAVRDGGSSSQQAGVMNIIEKKWITENKVYYNAPGQLLKIPLKYIPGTTSVVCRFSRVQGKSSALDMLSNSPLTLTGGSNEFVTLSRTNSNLKNINPGVFNFVITYNGVGIEEQGRFDLVKIGNVGNLGANSVVVLIGGNVQIEDAIFRLPEEYNEHSPACWSIARDFEMAGKNTWYIGTSNLNPLQKNAYNIGIALEKIKEFSDAISPNMSVLAHSKGGLEMRALMLDGKGAPMEIQDNFNLNPLNPFSNPTINSTLKSVVFLGTPHNDGVESGFITGYYLTSIAPSSFVTSQLNVNAIKNYFLNGTFVPNGMRIGNVSAYWKCDLSDGGVSLGSSSSPVLLGINQSLVQDIYVKDIGAPELNPTTGITMSIICNVICNSALILSFNPPQPEACGVACELSNYLYNFFREILWKKNFPSFIFNIRKCS